VAAAVVSPIDQHAAHAHVTHVGERYFLRALDHDVSSMGRLIAGEAGFFTFDLMRRVACPITP
jgi:hypothetical protein